MFRAFFSPLLCLVSLVSLVVLPGCRSVGKLGGVTVSVVALRSMESGGAAHGQVAMNLRFTNENVVPVGISRARHKLFLNGTLAGEVMNESPLGLPPLTSLSQDVTLPLTATAPAALRELAQRPQTSYRIESILYVDAGEEKMDIKTQNQGSVDLTGLGLN